MRRDASRYVSGGVMPSTARSARPRALRVLLLVRELRCDRCDVFRSMHAGRQIRATWGRCQRKPWHTGRWRTCHCYVSFTQQVIHPTQHVPWHRASSSRLSLLPPLGSGGAVHNHVKGGPRSEALRPAAWCSTVATAATTYHLWLLVPGRRPSSCYRKPSRGGGRPRCRARRWARTAAAVASACRSFLSPPAASSTHSNDVFVVAAPLAACRCSGTNMKKNTRNAGPYRIVALRAIERS
jgi:hypothetical protein